MTFSAAERAPTKLRPVAEMVSLGYATSENGRQPGLWAHAYGKGRVCVATPGHAAAQLAHPAYVLLPQKAAAWCAR